MRIVAIVQARMGSTRFPEKVMRPVCGTPLLGLLLQRLAWAKKLDKIIVATSIDPKNDPLADYVRSEGFDVYRGDEYDVLDRYYQPALAEGATVVVRITGDCPLVDPKLVDQCISTLQESGVDYCANNMPPTFPDGLDVEVFTFAALQMAFQQAKQPHQREHVTPFIRDSEVFKKINIADATDYSDKRWTVDEPEDFDVINAVFEHFQPDIHFSWLDVLTLSNDQPQLFASNTHLIRNEGAQLGTGQKLWKRAKRIIPGGNMLLSKRAEMFLPNRWPAYFSKARGCHVWDLDGNKYIDMSLMGVGTNILGYGHPEVDDAVLKTVSAGNMSTLNCPEEVYLAEKLIELHPWADMVRFARTGGEANAIAIRLARAASGRDKVVVCGYHGWHDWYLAANLGDEQTLAGHLLPGLDPKGVPSDLKGSVLTFQYNRYDELEALVREHNIGAIIMEVQRSEKPTEGFLENVRNLASKKGIVLIFDECSSGFRETFGGLHKKYGVNPDMAMFGKALGNGYAITAVIGRRQVMEEAQNTFISSTFWTERIGSAAALKTLEVMERIKPWEIITQTGVQIQQGWQRLADNYGLKINVMGLPALAGFSFDSPDHLKYKTFITQEMLKKGYLASNSVYACIDHDQETVDAYFVALDPLFAMIRDCEDRHDTTAILDGPVCHAGFKRLT